MRKYFGNILNKKTKTPIVARAIIYAAKNTPENIPKKNDVLKLCEEYFYKQKEVETFDLEEELNKVKIKLG